MENNDTAGTLGSFWNYSGVLWSVALQTPLSMMVWIVGILLTLARDWVRYRTAQAARDAEVQYLRGEVERLRARDQAHESEP